jgi:hypothetical protein
MAETIIRACGHAVEFTPRGDRYDDARREKLRTKRCPPCGQLKSAADSLAAKEQKSSRIKKGQEVKLLPPGTVFTLTRGADGGWHGTLAAGGVTVEASMGGAMGAMSKLARKWLRTAGVRVTGKVAD